MLTSEGLATYHCPSVQQNALSALVHQGPGAIVNPESVFNICAFSGIMSQLSTSADGIGSLTVSREIDITTPSITSARMTHHCQTIKNELYAILPYSILIDAENLNFRMW